MNRLIKNTKHGILRFTLYAIRYTINITRYKLHATRSRGFSLIELLVTIGIIILMIAVGIPAFSKFGRQSELDQAAELVKSSLLETQSLAMAPPVDKPTEVTLYFLFVESGRQKFGIKQGKLDPSNDNIVPVGSVVKSINLPSGINFQSTDYKVAYSTTAGSRMVGNSSTVLKIENPNIASPKVRKIEIYPDSGMITITRE